MAFDEKIYFQSAIPNKNIIINIGPTNESVGELPEAF